MRKFMSHIYSVEFTTSEDEIFVSSAISVKKVRFFRGINQSTTVTFGSGPKLLILPVVECLTNTGFHW